MRILVAEDNHETRMIIEFWLKREGFETTGVPDGNAALERLQSEPFDLLITDAVMPNLDGVELTRLIRSAEGGDKLPILMLSGLDTSLSRRMAFQAGVTDYMAKPMDQNEFVAKVKQLIGKK